VEKQLGRYLIGNINSAGYLTVTVEQSAHDLNVNIKQVEKVLNIIQNFDPAGIGARNLSECLILQLKQRMIFDEELQEIIENHLEDIGAGKLNKVASMMKQPVIRIQKLADIIKTLNPKPGASFNSGEEISYIVPDVTIELIDGEYIILVNDSQMPLLTINKTYSTILKKTSNSTDDDTVKFIENKLNQALWLIKSIEQRRTTIYNVTEALIKKQRDFFEKGAKYLKPLTLRQVAEEIGVHESTVSRATSNKYIQTPHGLFEFKYFFTPGLSTNTGTSTSTENIKQLIQEIIKGEDVTKPYSDQKIADMVMNRGISIARRSVSKYREELGILSTGQRRRYK
jgi:RNA polymerase sigma-54 factor